MLEKLTAISLKIKITAIVLALFISSLWILTVSVEKKLAHDMTELLETQQFSSVSYIAADLNEKIRQRIQLLELNASIITPELLASPEKAREFLRSRIGMQSLYKGGLAIISKDGKGIADYPPVPERTHASFREIEYFQEVLATGKTAIGKPRIGRFTKQPGVAIASPIKDKSGRLAAVLVGFATFSDTTLFGQVEHANVGKSGYITINVPKYNMIATSSNPSRIFKPMANPGVNRMVDQFNAGFEGSGIAVNSMGIETLTSAKQIPSAGWIAQIVLPTSEAFAPVHEMRFRAYSIALALTVFVLITVWLAIRHLLNPLVLASEKLGEMTSDALNVLPVKYNDEIGKLLNNFNALVNDRKQVYEELRLSEERFRNILDNAPIGMTVASLAGDFILVNRALCEIVGFEKEELEQMRFHDITHPDDLDSDLDNIKRLLNGKANSFQMEKRYFRKDQQVVWIQLTVSVLRDSTFSPLYFIAQIEDISERIRNREKIHQLAYYDALTNLPNRRLLKDRLNLALAQAKRYNRSLAVMYLDLDNFKQVNDSLGHDAGDELLKVVADRLLESVRIVDTVCRQSGDEFIIVLSEISRQQDVSFVAEKIINAINKPIHIRENKLQISTSIGIAVLPVNGTDDDKTLMKKADLAMYSVKNKGRNGFTIYGSDDYNSES